MNYEMGGGVVLSGQVSVTSPYYQYVGSGGITISSAVRQLSDFGIPDFSAVGSGGISLTNRYTYRQNITNSYNFDFLSSYSIQPYTEPFGPSSPTTDNIIIDFTSGYSVGEQRKYWWRIQCCCLPAEEGEGEEGPSEVSLMPLKFNSSINSLIEGLANNSIISPNLIKSLMPSISISSKPLFASLGDANNGLGNQKNKSRNSNRLNRSNGEISALYHEDDHEEEVLCQGIWNSGGSLTCGGNALSLISLVRAPTVNDVCAIIKAPMFGPEYLDIFSVLKIQKWVPEQRLWVDQEYCNAPNCISLCVDYAPEDDHAAFVMSVIENYNEAIGTGGVSLSGSAEASAIIGTCVGQGGVTIAGSLHSVISAAYSFNPNFIGKPPVSLGGSANIFVSHVNSRGGIFLSSSSIEVISIAHFYKSQGGLSIEGSGLDDVRFSTSYDDITYDVIFLTGAAEFTSLLKNFIYDSEGGGVSLSGAAEANSSRYKHDSDGMITISGISETISGRRRYQGEGGISIGGSSYLTRYVVASGGIAICRGYDFTVISGPTSTFDIVGFENRSRNLTFNNDGTKMFVVGETGDDVNEFNLSVGFDLSSSVTFVGTFSVSANCPNPTAVKFNPDGTKMFLTTFGNSNVHEYGLTTGFDVSTASFSQTLITSGNDSDNFGLDFSNDGTKMFITGNQNDKIYEYALSSAFDISTATFTQDLYLGTQDSEPFGIEFIDDGKKLFVVGTLDNGVDEYHLSSPYDISTASHVNFFGVSGNPSGIHINPSATKMFICGTSTDLVKEFDMNSGCDTESYFTFTYTGSGGVVLSGQTSGTTSPSFNFESSGLGPITVTNDGVYVSYRDLGNHEDTFSAVMSTSNLSLNLGNDIADGFSDLSINSGTINTCGCENVGLTIQLVNNLSKVSEIGSFIQRNKLNSLDSLRLHYVNGINSWNNVQHLSGLGADDVTENWKFVFQLSCTNKIENIELENFYFKFLLLVEKQIPSKNIKLKSMFLLNMDTSVMCSDSTRLLSSTITFDSFEKIPFVDENIIENFVYKDEIGIFSDSVWNKKLDYSLIRDDLASGPVVSGAFPTFKINIPIGQPLEYFMTLPDESIPKKQQQLLDSQIQNPLSQTDVDLKGQLTSGRPTSIALGSGPTAIRVDSPQYNTIFPPN